MNFAHLLLRRARETPDRPCLRDGDTRLSAVDLARRAAQATEQLRIDGVGAGDRVVVYLPHGAWSASAILGVLAAGAVAVPLNWQTSAGQVEHVLRATGAAVLLTCEGNAAHGRLHPRTSVPVRLVEDLPECAASRVVDTSDHDLAMILFTSGSTGGPRGVMISHANLWASVDPVVQYLGLHGSDRIASLLPFSFVYGLSQLTCALSVGAELIIVQPTITQDAVEALLEHSCTVVATVPPMWLQLMRAHELTRLSGIRVATCAGGRLAPEAVLTLRRALPSARLFLMYGFTEAFRSCWLDPAELDLHPDALGRSIAGAQVHVLRPDGTSCGDGEVGELVHAGPTVTLGYWNDVEATAARYLTFPSEAHGGVPVRAARSGDLVRRTADGLLYFVGRKDHQIKTLGFRVSPDEVVDALLATGLVREAAVTGEADDVRGQRIVAHVALAERADLRALRRAAARALPRYMLPQRWVEHTSIPRTPAGKHDLDSLWRGTWSPSRL